MDGHGGRACVSEVRNASVILFRPDQLICDTSGKNVTEGNLQQSPAI